MIKKRLLMGVSMILFAFALIACGDDFPSHLTDLGDYTYEDAVVHEYMSLRDIDRVRDDFYDYLESEGFTLIDFEQETGFFTRINNVEPGGDVFEIDDDFLYVSIYTEGDMTIVFTVRVSQEDFEAIEDEDDEDEFPTSDVSTPGFDVRAWLDADRVGGSVIYDYTSTEDEVGNDLYELVYLIDLTFEGEGAVATLMAAVDYMEAALMDQDWSEFTVVDTEPYDITSVHPDGYELEIRYQEDTVYDDALRVTVRITVLD